MAGGSPRIASRRAPLAKRGASRSGTAADRDRAADREERRAAADRDRRRAASTATSPPTAPAPTATCSRPTSRRRSSTASGSTVPSRDVGAADPRRGERSTRRRSNRSATRMEVISSRRGPVIGLQHRSSGSLALALVAAAQPRRAGAAGGARRRPDGRLPAAVLLLGAALEPGETAERLLVLLGAPLLAALTLLLLRGYRALAVASALTVLAYAVDVIAGSPLTSLSLLGPNPGLGVRFYGIGNELEALLAVLVVAGTGAGAGRRSRRSAAAARPRRRLPRRRPARRLRLRRRAASAPTSAPRSSSRSAPPSPPRRSPAAAGGRCVARRGRGALRRARPAGAGRPRSAAPTPTSPARSSTPAGWATSPTSPSAACSSRPTASPGRSCSPSCRWCCARGLAYVRRDRLRAWLAGPGDARRPARRLAATVVGTLANDSGALLLEIGAAYLLVFTGFAWAESANAASSQTKSYTSCATLTFPYLEAWSDEIDLDRFAPRRPNGGREIGRRSDSA